MILLSAIVLILDLIGSGEAIGDHLEAVWPKVLGTTLATIVFVALMRFAKRHS